jgi:ribosome-binding protein aMBF1 (putative translation factor)
MQNWQKQTNETKGGIMNCEICGEKKGKKHTIKEIFGTIQVCSDCLSDYKEQYIDNLRKKLKLYKKQRLK